MRLRGFILLLLGLILAVGCTHDSDIDNVGGSTDDGIATMTIDAILPNLAGTTRAVDSALGGTVNVDFKDDGHADGYVLRIIAKAYGTGDNANDIADEDVYFITKRSDLTASIKLDLEVTAGREYKVYLWADYVKEYGADGMGVDLHYNTENLPLVTLKEEYGLNDESRDALYGVIDWEATGNKALTATLTRPLAKLRMMATDADTKADKVEITYDGTLYNTLNIATGEASTTDNNTTHTLTATTLNYTDGDDGDQLKTNQTVLVDYLIVPKDGMNIGIRASFLDGSDNEINALDPITDVKLKRGHLTTLRGEMLAGGWDGTTLVEPMTIDGEWLVLNEVEELAWVLQNEDTKGKNKIRITTDMDMGGNVVKPFPVQVSDFDGNNKSISNVVVDGNSLFTIDKALSIHDLNVDTITVGDDTTTGHVGVLLDEVKLDNGDNVTYSNVSIRNARVNTTNGAAGGLIGYIGRADETNRDVTYSVTIDNCQLTDVTAAGSLSEGHLVGLFSGYDSGETLIIKDNCTVDNATTRVDDYVSHYTAAQQSCWLEPVDSKYDAMLGDEVYHRGTVYFGDKLFVPKWDGITTVEPLTEDGSTSIYSAFDLAYLQKGSHSSVTFKSDVDLGGSYTKSKNKFNPIRTITNLDGQGHTLYDLYVDMVHDGTGAAFIQTASGTTTHKNLTFERAYIKNVHNTNIPTPAYGVTDDGGAGNAYAGTLVSHTGGDYTAENVHFKNGTVYAVCKMGGAIGYVGSTNFKMKDCSVDKYVVENYEPGVPNYYTLPRRYTLNLSSVQSVSGLTSLFGVGKIPSTAEVNCLQWWYTNGECGGLIGFIKSKTATIDHCSVTNTEINCVGQDNKPVVANVWDSADFNINDPYRSGVKIFAKGNTDVAGRHVNQFIGDVVSERKEGGSDYNITVSDYTVSGNSYNGIQATSTNKYSHNYASGKYCEVVGCAYYIGVDVKLFGIDLTHVNDCAGTLTFNALNFASVTITEEVKQGNSISWTGGSFTDAEYKQKRSGSLFRPTWSYNVDSYYPGNPE
ncbi:MAG: hypothetical protein IKJ38_04180 [Alistipes sp.]|nr:hypothetical protein [Alistipes sp.]